MILEAATVPNTPSGATAFRVFGTDRYVVVIMERIHEAPNTQLAFRFRAREVDPDGTPVDVNGMPLDAVEAACTTETAIGVNESVQFPGKVTSMLAEATERAVQLALNHTTVMRQLAQMGLASSGRS